MSARGSHHPHTAQLVGGAISAVLVVPVCRPGAALALRGLPGEMYAEVVTDVDPGVLGDPGAGGRVLEHRCQPVVDGLGEVDDAPLVQRGDAA